MYDGMPLIEGSIVVALGSYHPSMYSGECFSATVASCGVRGQPTFYFLGGRGFGRSEGSLMHQWYAQSVGRLRRVGQRGG